MLTRIPQPLLAIIAGVAFALSMTNAWADDGEWCRYWLTDLFESTSGLDDGGASDINARGEIVGALFGDVPEDLTPFYWRNGKLERMGIPEEYDGADAVAINDGGVIAGMAGSYPYYNTRPVRWETYDSSPRTLPVLDPRYSTFANDINNAGTMVGIAHLLVNRHLIFRAVAWPDADTIVDLGKDYSEAWGINDRGDIVGQAGFDDSPNSAAIWTAEGLRILPAVVEGEPASGRAINNNQVVVGFSDVPPARRIQVFSAGWDRNGVPRFLSGPQPKFGHSSAVSINDFGVAVGTLAALHEGGGVIYRKKKVILADSLIVNLPEGKTVSNLQSVNNAGQIVGYLSEPAIWNLHPVLLTPIDLSLEVVGEPRAGDWNEVQVSGAAPGNELRFVYGVESGYQTIPGETCGGKGFAIQNARILGAAVADADGQAVFRRYVSDKLRGKTVYLQVVERETCKLSNRVEAVFQ